MFGSFSNSSKVRRQTLKSIVLGHFASVTPMAAVPALQAPYGLHCCQERSAQANKEQQDCQNQGPGIKIHLAASCRLNDEARGTEDLFAVLRAVFISLLKEP